MSENMLDKMPNRMPNGISEYMPERMPNAISKYMSNRMADIMSENMSDRISVGGYHLKKVMFYLFSSNCSVILTN